MVQRVRVLVTRDHISRFRFIVRFGSGKWFSQLVSARVSASQHSNGSVAGFRLGFGSWSKAVNESMVRSIQSTQVNSGQPVNCRVNWSNARRGKV
ncbi:hypothetical protein HanXRQr2_Chr04g0154561 [Helianthus annuus]|uniref:Uncharacterized protein n=1 Tax=Helianthus annuus TaxID=4232 RepID=A0A9K3J5V4_HELAN|nr:hypothetical protein HanXRQr2_Chr04g0154561 [Helianthus annuus]